MLLKLRRCASFPISVSLKAGVLPSKQSPGRVPNERVPSLAVEDWDRGVCNDRGREK